MSARQIPTLPPAETFDRSSGWQYAPLPTQRKFHADLRTLHKGFSGPIGSGKSVALVYEALFLSALNPGLLGLIGAPTYPMLRDATLRNMFDVLANEGIRYDHWRSENILVLPDPPFFGAQILCRSVDDFERLRGTNLAWFGLDELTYCPQAAWSRLLGRLRHPGANRRCAFGVWTPNGYDWVYKLFISEPAADYKAYLASPRENKYVTETGLYDSLLGTYDEQLYRQEVLGEYLNVRSGQVYFAFKRQAHVSEAADYNPRLPLCFALDFNVNPLCAVIAQIEDRSTYMDTVHGRKDLHINVIDELFLHNSNTAEACEEFVNHTRDYRRNGVPLTVSVYGDATGSQRKTAAGAGAQSDWAVIKEYFRVTPGYQMSFRYTSTNPLVKDRVASVNGVLRSAAGECRLQIHPRCKNLVEDLEQVVWKSGAAQLDQSTDPMRTHISDALGYLVHSKLALRSRVGEVGTSPV